MDALDSLVAQSFTNWEVIVVLDGGEKLPWIHPFAKVLDTGGHKGPAAARNLGFSVARGSQILLLDADDYLQPKALEMFWLNRKPGAYLYCDWVQQEKREIHRTAEYDCKEVLRHLQHAVTGLYPAEAWRAVGGFDEQLDAWEDWDFMIALGAKGYYGIRIPIPLFQYRMEAGFRREEQYQNRNELKKRIYAKWQQYIEGKVEYMACHTCGGRKDPILVPPMIVRNGTVQQISGMVLIEYLPTDGSIITYRGSSTGTLYRFGSDKGHRIKNVFKNDAPNLLMRKEFRQVVATAPSATVAQEPLLEALGAPKR
jgi:glycosyltransferase involved in cell wall biosynthesis